MTGKRTPAPRPCPTWDPDPELGTDWYGKETCRTCHRPGTADDAAHRPPPPPPVPQTRISPALAAAAQARDAAILGEHDPEEYR
ncbi:hypothetical protein O7622_01090 [Micromonospora sp. WMMD1076]|uniref:hypothetical protein n=1 Tax=Micromonospora sp. WMMD1076 TaxID=3016103 RepID=UPI00249B5E36|nr:hypothetical protein [Micromonospora sp. WMMD1076]WFF07225.1 hypothetical protein O7622_01090 [Micromonospora sp. WMMD1076]